MTGGKLLGGGWQRRRPGSGRSLGAATLPRLRLPLRAAMTVRCVRFRHSVLTMSTGRAFGTKCARGSPGFFRFLRVLGLPRFGGRLRAVATGTGVNDSRWNEISLGDRC